jgi:hypothetical protein
MTLLMDVATGTNSEFPWAFALVYGVGFIAAVTIGSIAWYNSKRPPGWEDKQRPDAVPKVDAEDPSV